MRSLLGCVLVLAGLAGVAHADPPPAPRDAYDPHPHGGFGVNVGGGVTSQPGAPDGWFARLDYELFQVLGLPHHVGPILGFTGGLEYWRSAPSSGFAMPVRVVGGIRIFPFRVLLGAGGEGFLIDHHANATGFGLWAPSASATVGVDAGGVTVSLDARVTRRWQFGADDYTQWTVGVMVGGLLERSEPKPKPAKIL